MKRQLQSRILTTRFSPRALTSLMACSALSALGCAGGDPRDLGSSSIPLEYEAETEPLTPQDFIGSWVGVALDALALTETGESAPLAFASGSSRVRLVVHGDGVFPDRFASLTFGEGEPPPVPTDPDAPPPGIPPEYIDYNPFNTPPLEGFPYALNPARIGSEGEDLESFGIGNNHFDLADGILRLGFYADEIVEDFCLLQPVGASPVGCSCDDSGCSADVSNPVDLWVRHSPEGLVGIFTGRLPVFNARGAITSLGQIRFTPEE